MSNVKCQNQNVKCQMSNEATRQLLHINKRTAAFSTIFHQNKLQFVTLSYYVTHQSHPLNTSLSPSVTDRQSQCKADNNSRWCCHPRTSGKNSSLKRGICTISSLEFNQMLGCSSNAWSHDPYSQKHHTKHITKQFLFGPHCKHCHHMFRVIQHNAHISLLPEKHTSLSYLIKGIKPLEFAPKNGRELHTMDFQLHHQLQVRT